jgi:alanine dehydrogenase
MAVQVGAHYLQRPNGGRGLLLGGVPGVHPAKVLVIGAGVVGRNAARMAAGLGARVFLLDINLERLRELAETMPANVVVLHSSLHTIRHRLPSADLVVGAVLVEGARAPVLVREQDLETMQPGSVIVDVAVDQGGCIETCKPTTHRNPTYEVHGVLHYCVANMPGAVSRSLSFALSNATSPWVLRLAEMGPAEALRRGGPLASAANVIAGKVTHKGVAGSFDLQFTDPSKASPAPRPERPPQSRR